MYGLSIIYPSFSDLLYSLADEKREKNSSNSECPETLILSKMVYESLIKQSMRLEGSFMVTQLTTESHLP